MHNPVKLAYLVSQYPALSHTFIEREIVGLRARGFEIWPASIRNADWPHDEDIFYIKEKGFRGALKAWLRSPIQGIRGLFYALRNGYRIYYWAEALILGHWMQDKGIKHIHVHFANPAALAALLAARMFPVTYSLTIHGPDEFYDAQRQFIKEKVENSLFTVAISYFAKSQIMKFISPKFWDKITIVRLGIDPEILTEAPFRDHPEIFELLMIGRLSANKGGRILLQALKLLSNEVQRYHLTLVGGGEEEKALVSFAQDNLLPVTFTGGLPFAKAKEFYKIADLFVLPSFAEGVPVVLMEAMGHGIATISSGIHGIPELIESKESGWLIPPGDPHLLADAIKTLSGNPSLRKKIAANGRNKVVELYNLPKNLDQLAKVFHRYLG
jgi:glycosyltransferase involved in cell wall biosynthesis